MKTARKDWKGTKKLLLWMTAAAMTFCLGACNDKAGQDGKESKKAGSVEASADVVTKVEAESKEESKQESKQESEQALPGDLFDHAQKVLDLMLEKAQSETYFELITASESIRKSDEYQKLVSSDYSAPEKIYRIRLKDEFNNLLLSTATEGNSAKINELSEDLKKDLKARISGSFVTMLNARKSAQTVALASILSTGNLYLDESMSDDSGMLIYCYKDAYPLIVCYACSQEGIVSMSGNVIFYDDFKADSEGEMVTSLLSFFPDELKFIAGTDMVVEVIQ